MSRSIAVAAPAGDLKFNPLDGADRLFCCIAYVASWPKAEEPATIYNRSVF
jgi:hypothetical protein